MTSNYQTGTLVLLAALLASACDDSDYKLVLSYPDNTAFVRAQRVEVAVGEELSCDQLRDRDDEPLLSYEAHDTPPALGSIERGEASFLARVYDLDCLEFLDGCVQVDLSALEDHTVHISLRSIRPVGCDPGLVCRLARCTPGDAAVLDAARADLIVADAGAHDIAAADRTVIDSAARDSSDADSSAPDGFVLDAAAPDAAAPDADLPDASQPDGNLPDSNLPDSNLPDTSEPLDAAYSHGSQQLAIARNLDDGEIIYGWSGEWFPDGESGSGYNYIGYYATRGEPVWGYFRFELASAIPAGSVVQEARLLLRGRARYSWEPAIDYLVVAAEQRADALQVAGKEDRPGGTSGTTLTSAVVRWPASGGLTWSTTGDNQTPDLAPVFQELVDTHGGLAAGAHVQLWLHDPDESADSEVAAEDFSYATGTGEHARLSIDWLQP